MLFALGRYDVKSARTTLRKSIFHFRHEAPIIVIKYAQIVYPARIRNTHEYGAAIMSGTPENVPAVVLLCYCGHVKLPVREGTSFPFFRSDVRGGQEAKGFQWDHDVFFGIRSNV